MKQHWVCSQNEDRDEDEIMEWFEDDELKKQWEEVKTKESWRWCMAI